MNCFVWAWIVIAACIVALAGDVWLWREHCQQERLLESAGSLISFWKRTAETLTKEADRHATTLANVCAAHRRDLEEQSAKVTVACEDYQRRKDELEAEQELYESEMEAKLNSLRAETDQLLALGVDAAVKRDRLNARRGAGGRFTSK